MEISQVMARILLLGGFVSALLFTADPALHAVALLSCIGGCCNLLVVVANGGRMPVVQGKRVKDDRHVAVSSRTKLRFLCDRYRIMGSRRSPIFRLGDIFMFLAILVLLLKILGVL
jgi:hypothetical protein